MEVAGRRSCRGGRMRVTSDRKPKGSSDRSATSMAAATTGARPPWLSRPSDGGRWPALMSRGTDACDIRSEAEGQQRQKRHQHGGGDDRGAAAMAEPAERWRSLAGAHVEGDGCV